MLVFGVKTDRSPKEVAAKILKGLDDPYSGKFTKRLLKYCRFKGEYEKDGFGAGLKTDALDDLWWFMKQVKVGKTVRFRTFIFSRN